VIDRELCVFTEPRGAVYDDEALIGW